MSSTPRIFLVCSGLDHINRGYESFSKECFEALKNEQNLNLYLIKGSGQADDKILSVACIQRNSFLAKLISRLTGKSGYFIEQLSFFLRMVPLLLKYRPSLIYFSDFQLGTFCWRLRRLTGLKYKLLFSNGAPNGPPFSRMDHVQQLLPFYYRKACEKGVSSQMQTILSYAINIDREKHLAAFANKSDQRTMLGLPLDKKVIISVGAVNSHHKRMDYVVHEFSRLRSENYYLLILGQLDESSDSIIDLAQKTLPKDGYTILETTSEQVREYMCVADYFILASTAEGLPRVLPEALSAGLLPIVHDYDVTRETLGEYGLFLDLTNIGVLEDALKSIDKLPVTREQLLQYAIEKFSWGALKSQYLLMLQNCLE